ncbi:GNAT family N-acetyltransferase [Siccirubricoccus sp. KC 17139]|uniref:GNAT family N-acetyltransferase n=1 Tax=Siccirubricoccus soli TaxID=2899147 RepID=A0ABT1CZY4_9PROT|nr:GNAT family N-acetyltransferase [Siccirubricoccus soli]MCO6414977.1 GNAT family N-acetyltransferase [Siccirubricoccus soli]MCP2681108.1 GNAT family N-acetyltransferase [Siccirubricoccus soli]
MPATAALQDWPCGALPAWSAPWLDAVQDPLGGRLWYETTLAQALPPGAAPVAAMAGPVLLPLLRRGGALASLTTDYSLGWHPLVLPGTDPAALAEAGRALAPLLRRRPPTRLEALAEDDPRLPPLLAGLRAGGLIPLHFRHFGNWREVLPEGMGWAAYLAARPPAHRNTVARKLARAGREFRFECLAAPGPALEAGIADFAAVRAGSWKPAEPAPHFDAALMRALAPTGALRLGLLRNRDDRPLAAQYWVLHRGCAVVPKLFHLEAARAASPGTVLTALMIRRLIEEDGVRALDFGRGDDGYKRLWVGRRRQRMGVLLVDPWHPAGALALARHAAGRLRAALGRAPARDAA